jgi:hypothetical protein
MLSLKASHPGGIRTVLFPEVDAVENAISKKISGLLLSRYTFKIVYL